MHTYHSGTTWAGVSKGSAGIQLSGWFKKFGKYKTKNAKNVKKQHNAKTSFEKKYG